MMRQDALHTRRERSGSLHTVLELEELALVLALALALDSVAGTMRPTAPPLPTTPRLRTWFPTTNRRLTPPMLLLSTLLRLTALVFVSASASLQSHVGFAFRSKAAGVMILRPAVDAHGHRFAQGLFGKEFDLATHYARGDVLNFLGGKKDYSDRSPAETALREFHEETGKLLSSATRSRVARLLTHQLWLPRGKCTCHRVAGCCPTLVVTAAHLPVVAFCRRAVCRSAVGPRSRPRAVGWCVSGCACHCPCVRLTRHAFPAVSDLHALPARYKAWKQGGSVFGFFRRRASAEMSSLAWRNASVLTDAPSSDVHGFWQNLRKQADFRGLISTLRGKTVAGAIGSIAAVGHSSHSGPSAERRNGGSRGAWSPHGGLYPTL